MAAPTASTEHLREAPLDRDRVFAGRLIAVHVDRVLLPGGGAATREVVEHPGAVAVVAVAGSDIVLVRQWRHPIGRALWEVPAGTREPGEAAEVTARRELGEETGYRATRWRSLGDLPLAPGYSTEIIGFYEATGLETGTPATDPDETVEVQLFGPAELARLIDRREVDIKTVAGLALAGRIPALDA